MSVIAQSIHPLLALEMPLLRQDTRTACEDGQMGMEWWNGLSDQDRETWAARAGTGRASDAWEIYKRRKPSEMSDRFAVGDRVRCVKAFATVGNLEEGGEYTVVQSGAGYVRLAEDDFYLWRVDRFEPVEA